MEDRRWIWSRIAILSLLFSILVLCTGCNVSGFAAYKLFGPPPVPAKYVLPPLQPTLVLVENYSSLSDSQSDSDRLMRYLHEELLAQEVGPLIDYREFYRVRDVSGQGFKQMNITQVGKAAGAQQVLYVDLQQSSVGSSVSGDLISGQMGARVKVVDVQSGATLWPDAADGYPISFESPHTTRFQVPDENAFREGVYRGMAQQIGNLFHEWKPDDLDDPLYSQAH